MTPAVSIVTPTYNRAHLLPRAWASISRQTETHLEWIVDDDGSTDDTRNVVRKFNDRRIHYIHQENKGMGAARNRADAEVRADYVVYLDSDDELLNEATLADMLSEIRAAHRDIAWVAFTIVDSEGRPGSHYLAEDRLHSTYIDHVCEEKIRGDFIAIYRKDVVQDAPWPQYRAVMALRHWRIVRNRPALMLNRPALVYHRDSGDNLSSAPAAIGSAKDAAAALAALIADHEAAWKRHCPCQLGKYHFYRAMYLALSGISVRVVPDLLVALRYGSSGIRAKGALLLCSLVFPLPARRWLFLKWQRA